MRADKLPADKYSENITAESIEKYRQTLPESAFEWRYDVADTARYARFFIHALDAEGLRENSE